MKKYKIYDEIWQEFSTTIAASCAFILPIATPPNAVIFGSGQLDIKDMIKAGIGLNIISALVVSILSIVILNLFFGLQITSIPEWALSGKIN